jgi:hypothetical protein
MCNPVWTHILGDSTLKIDVDPQDSTIVVARVVESPSGDTRMCGFPISIPIRPRSGVMVTVTATSPGPDSTVTVTAQITGEDSRGPDVCRLRVNATHPIALETIMASGA